MIENWDELDLHEGAKIEEWDKILKEKLNIGISDLQSSLCTWMKQNAGALAKDFKCIAPYGRYVDLLDEEDAISSFLATECSQPEHWQIILAKADHNLLQFIFDCDIVDDGESLKGFVYIGKTGMIRHVFAQSQD